MLLIFVLFSLTMCTVTSAALFNTSSYIKPQFQQARYEVYLSLNVSKPYANLAYVAVYNKNNRMIAIEEPQVAAKRVFFYVNPEEYPFTVKAFVWSESKTAIPFGESYTFPELETTNTLISNQLGDFVNLLKKNFIKPGSENTFWYKITSVLDDIDENIIQDAKEDELVIDRNFFVVRYPDAYSKVRVIADEFKKSGDINKAFTDLSSILDKNPQYEQLVFTLFTLLGVYDYL